jgi:hypothetical protein
MLKYSCCLHQVFYNQAKNVRQIDIPTMSGNMGILGAWILKEKKMN